MGKLSGPHSFFPVEQETVDLLMQEQRRLVWKTTVITSATFYHRCLQSEEEEEEEEEERWTNGGFGRFLPGSLARYFSYLGGREMLK